MAIAKIENYNGEPAFIIDGKPYPPFTYVASNHASGTVESEEEFVKQIKARYAAGDRLIYLFWGKSDWSQPGNKNALENTSEDLFKKRGPLPEDMYLSASEELYKKCKLVLDNVPDDVYLGVMIDLNPPRQWYYDHPEELIKYSDGKSHPLIVSGTGEVPGMFSICSDVYRKDASKALEEMLDKINAFPFADRIASILLSGGGTCEWYYPEGNEFTEYSTNTYADFSEPFRKNFSEFLRNKYGTEENLKKVWNDKDASFDNPKIPDIDERKFINIDEEILDAMANYESADRAIGKKINLDGKATANLGVFLNVNEYQNVADFYQAISYGTAKSLSQFCSIVREKSPNRAIITFFGGLGCTNYFNFGTSSAALELLDSGNVDMLCSAASYNNREPGGYLAHRLVQDSLAIRNTLFSNEGDSRCHYTEPFYRDLMRLYDVKDTLNTFKREFAQQLTDNIQGWWYHFDEKFVEDGISDLMLRMKEIANFSYSQDRRKNHEIAVIYDLESLHYVSNDTDALIMEFYRVSDLGRIGAPVDYYYHNDMSNPKMPDYKMYIMLNCYCLTDKEIEEIKAKARKNNAVVLWLYAPGFINTDAKDIMSNENIEAVTGMKVNRIDKTSSPRFKVVGNDHPALKFADLDQFYGYIDRDIHSGIWPGSIYAPPKVKAQPPAFANPFFYIEEQDDITVLGRYCLDKQIAMAMKDDDGYTSVYCSSHVVRSELLKSLASYAGVHIYVENDDFISADDTLVSIHAHNTGKRKIYFKKPCSPYEVYEKKYYGHDITELELDMRLGDTLTFSVRGEC